MVKAVQGKGVGRDAAERGVGSDLVVIAGTPVLDEQAGLGEGTEPMLVKTVATKGAIKTLDEGVLSGLARLDVMKSDAGALSLEVKSLAGKLGTVFDSDGVRKFASEGEAFHDGDDGGATDGGIDMDG